MTLAELLHQARQGNEQAIAQLIAQSLPLDSKVKARWQHRRLQLLLESEQSLDSEAILPILQRGFQRLAMQRPIDSVCVYARHPQQDFPDWVEEFSLKEQSGTPTAATPSPQASAAATTETTAASTSSEPEPFLSDTTLLALAQVAPLFGYLFWLIDIAPGWPWNFNGTFLLPWRIVPPLLLLLRSTESTFVKRQAREALNFQISFLIYWVVTLPLILVLVGLLIAIPLALTEVVCVIIATVKASEARFFRYPLTIRFVKE